LKELGKLPMKQLTTIIPPNVSPPKEILNPTTPRDDS
jgi:hypothetical protein